MWVYILIQPGVWFCHISQQSAFTQVFDSCWSPEISVFSTFSSPCQQLNMEKELSCEVWCSKKERSRSWQEGQLRNNPCWQKKSGKKPYQKFQPLKDKVLKGTVCVSLKVSLSRTRILRSRDPSSKIPQAAIPLATWSLSIRHNAPLYVASWRKNPYHLYQQKTCGLYTICHSRCDIICDIYDICVCNNSPSQKKLSTFLHF